MKHGSRQSREARQVAAEGAEGKASGRTPTQPTNAIARYVNASPLAAVVKSGDSYPLLADLDSEDELAERLKAHGCDIYAGGEYPTYADRLGACIVRNGMQAIIVGRSPDGRPENYAQAYERLYGKPLTKARKAGAG